MRYIPLASHPGVRLNVSAPERRSLGVVFLSTSHVGGLYLGAMMTLNAAEARELGAQLTEAAEKVEPRCRVSLPCEECGGLPCLEGCRPSPRPSTANEFMQGKAL
jgi:hypothetical protein